MDTFPIAEKIYLDRISNHIQKLAAAYFIGGGRLMYDGESLDDEDVKDMLTPSIIIWAESLLLSIGDRSAESTAFLFTKCAAKSGELPLKVRLSRHRRPSPLINILPVIDEIFEVDLLTFRNDIGQFIEAACRLYQKAGINMGPA